MNQPFSFLSLTDKANQREGKSVEKKKKKKNGGEGITSGEVEVESN